MSSTKGYNKQQKFSRFQLPKGRSCTVGFNVRFMQRTRRVLRSGAGPGSFFLEFQRRVLAGRNSAKFLNWFSVFMFYVDFMMFSGKLQLWDLYVLLFLTIEILVPLVFIMCMYMTHIFLTVALELSNMHESSPIFSCMSHSSFGKHNS